MEYALDVILENSSSSLFFHFLDILSEFFTDLAFIDKNSFSDNLGLKPYSLTNPK